MPLGLVCRPQSWLGNLKQTWGSFIVPPHPSYDVVPILFIQWPGSAFPGTWWEPHLSTQLVIDQLWALKQTLVPMLPYGTRYWRQSQPPRDQSGSMPTLSPDKQPESQGLHCNSLITSSNSAWLWLRKWSHHPRNLQEKVFICWKQTIRTERGVCYLKCTTTKIWLHRSLRIRQRGHHQRKLLMLP